MALLGDKERRIPPGLDQGRQPTGVDDVGRTSDMGADRAEVQPGKPTDGRFDPAGN